ncbi:MAG: WbuC family cupin fold metalloprotein [Methanoregula sp.]|jgi:cupin fold WbuC family metalloprotein|uniref:WbuC family cupin fold metalloprotein n=1 Tax=Methanoregula sp. TaxID=2052170 RepID=UPI0025E872C1|nr:WbuC family cupin fold metalloprotein [Methanoregula sp.]MCK9630289.1 WbuC family cupin fold metalloprotein [Methanoregula sp.]
MNYSKFNDEVLFAIDPVVKISKEDITHLKQLAERTTRKRSRLCAHKDIRSPLHEMLIVHKQDTYVRPHKHLGKSESFHLIDGEVLLLLFEDNGNLREVIQMGDYNSGKIFYYRIDNPIFHSIVIKSESTVFHESTKGPFIRENTIFADWAPEEGDEKGIFQFMKRINQKNLER